MVIAIVSILVALFLGFGAVQEFIVRGVNGGEIQPLLVGVAGMIVNVLLAVAGIALWRRWTWARRFAIVAAISTIILHVYAALPPHRYVGFLVLLVAVGYGLVLLGVVLTRKDPKTQTA